MASKKPVIQAHVEDSIKVKIMVVARSECRSLSSLLTRLCLDEIHRYESLCGEITKSEVIKNEKR